MTSSEWTFLPTRLGYGSNTNRVSRFRCVDSSVDFMHEYRVQQVEPWRQLGLSALHGLSLEANTNMDKWPFIDF